MYALNGVPLDNSALKWVFRAPSKPLSAFLLVLSSLQVPGRDGYISVPTTIGGPVIPIVVYSPRNAVESLHALFFASPLMLSLATSPQRQVACTLMSIANAAPGKPNAGFDVTATLRLDTVWWRDLAVSTSTALALTTSPTVVPAFSGISAPVRDSIIRVTGPVSNLLVASPDGSWFSYAAAIPAGSYLRFESDTGRAYITTTNVWTGGTEVTGSIANGPGPYALSIVPTFSTDPSTRTGQLTATFTGQAVPAAIEVRGKGSYVFAEA